MGSIRARFAPSPTGYLHVGGARTALFNWLFCQSHGGKFILRIEDTDVSRNVEGAEAKLIDDLRWLGLDYDEGPGVGGALGPYRQSDRRDLYDAAVSVLLERGDAYYAFDTPEELEALRRAAMAEKRTFRYPRPDPLPSRADADRARREGRPVVVRFKMPDEPITVRDEILGEVSFAAGQLEDLVIVKSNGWPTYHFAVVVDDAHMLITHVLRAQEHLMNTPKHVFLQRALGYPTPIYAHLPLVFNIDGTKMSKRDRHRVVRTAIKQFIKQGGWSKERVAQVARSTQAAADAWLDKEDNALDMVQVGRLADETGVHVPEIDVHDFRASGYLPEALLNFIALIGWSPGGDREKLTLQEMIDLFDLSGISKTAGRFDREKLLAFNTDYCAAADRDRLLVGFRDYAAVSGSPMALLDDATLGKVLEVCRGFNTFAHVEAKTGVLFAADEAVVHDARAVAEVLARDGGAGYAMLRLLVPKLEALSPWTAAAVDELVKAVCKETGASVGEVAQPLRVAVAGRPVSPAIGATLELLGRERTLARVRRCLQ